MTIEELKSKFDKETVLWIVSFIGVCVLVALGKLNSSVIEMFLFAVIGRAGAKQLTNGEQK